MAKSKIIKELANNKATLEVAMNRLMVIASDIDNDELLEWAESELSGYRENRKVPEYRKFDGLPIVYSGINGSFQVTNIPLDLHGILDEDLIKSAQSYVMVQDLMTIEKLGNTKDEISQDMSYLQSVVYSKTGIQCTSIKKRIPINLFSNVLSVVKTKLLRVLIMLDKEYGNLDDLDIDDSSVTEAERTAINQTINNFIFNDKSVTIGDKNKIDDSTFNTGE